MATIPIEMERQSLRTLAGVFGCQPEYLEVHHLPVITGPSGLALKARCVHVSDSGQ
jgi:hypothetical protein